MKRAFSLLEIMIVILLITLITGAIGYNMKGALEKGKAFRTERAREQLHDLLLYCLVEQKDKDIDYVIKNAEILIRSTGLAKNPDELLKDGWGNPFTISARGKTDFNITSERLTRYNNDHNLSSVTPAKTQDVDDF